MLTFFSTEQLRPVYSFMPPKAALALKLVEYIATRDVDVLSKILDTAKVFTVMLHYSEALTRVPEEKAFVRNLFESGISEKSLDKRISDYKEKGRMLKEKIHGDLTEQNPNYLINRYHILGRYYSNYEQLDHRAKSRPNKANILDYPSLQAAIELLERNRDVSEANEVLPILYILMGTSIQFIL